MKLQALVTIVLLICSSHASAAEPERSIYLPEWTHAGVTYVHAFAEMLDGDTILLRGMVKGIQSESVRIPWKSAPWNLKSRLKKQQAEAADLDKYIAQQKSKGLQFITGKIIGHTPDGFLVRDLAMGVPVHVRGQTALFDGDEWSGWARFTGTYQYTATGGRLATIRGFAAEK